MAIDGDCNSTKLLTSSHFCDSRKLLRRKWYLNIGKPRNPRLTIIVVFALCLVTLGLSLNSLKDKSVAINQVKFFTEQNKSTSAHLINTDTRSKWQENRTQKFPNISHLHVQHRRLSAIYRQMSGIEEWMWIMERMKKYSDVWHNACFSNTELCKQEAISILVVPGVLTLTDFAKMWSIKKGGPLGDLVQWTDLILGLAFLGHNVTVVKNLMAASQMLLKDVCSSQPCVSQQFDLIFTDIIGFLQLAGGVRRTLKCRFRILDFFGTQAMYNDIEYAKKFNFHSNYGLLDLNLKQFYTFYSLTIENTFLGYANYHHGNNVTKENIALLYGKSSDYFKDDLRYISFLQMHTEVHTTIPSNSILPKGIVNDGVLAAGEYWELLDRAKYFVGFGQPVEGPALIEALTHGCIVLNPIYKGSQRDLLKSQGKPTSRKITSQSTYLEQNVGPPHVFTIDKENLTEVEAVLRATKTRKIEHFTMNEFTIGGFLTRLKSHIEHQDFCDKSSDIWPEPSRLVQIISESGQSCEEACKTVGCVCEYNFFPILDIAPHCHNESFLVRNHICFPAIEPASDLCYYQNRPMLYSCSQGCTGLQRICPCRGQ